MAEYRSASAQIAPPDHAPTVDGSMQDVCLRLGRILDEATASCGVLEDIGERAFGSSPISMAKAAGENKPTPSGLAYRVSDLLTQIVTMQERTRDAIQRVGSAI